MQPRSRSIPGDRGQTRRQVVAGSKKKSGFVASTAAQQKKRVIVRRQSTISSSKTATKIDTRNANQSSAKRMLPTFLEAPRSKEKAPPRLQGNFSPDRLATQSSRKWRSSKFADSGPSTRLHSVEKTVTTLSCNGCPSRKLTCA
jgi:hypothetical protein